MKGPCSLLDDGGLWWLDSRPKSRELFAMPTYKRFGRYRATFTPRDNQEFRLRGDRRSVVGQSVSVMYNGRIEDEPGIGFRAGFQGDHEFTLLQDGADWPAWFSERDLSDIRPIPERAASARPAA